MKKKSLFQKFILLVIPLVIVTALSIGLGMGLISQEAFLDTIRADYRVAAASTARHVEYYLKNALEETRAAAALVSAVRLDPWRTHMTAAELRHTFPRFQYISLVDMNGYEVVNSWFNQDLYNRDGWLTFEEASKGRLAYSRTVIMDRIPVMFMAAPVFRDGTQTGIIWARLNLKPVWDVAIQLKRDLNFGPDGHVYLVDQDKTLVASDEISRRFGQFFQAETPSSDADSASGGLLDWQEDKWLDTQDSTTLKALLAGRHDLPEFWIETRDGVKTILVKSDIRSISWTLYLMQPYNEAFHFLYKGLWASAGLAAVILLIALPLTWYVTRRFLAPMARLHHGVARAARGDLGTPLDVGTQDEVGELADHFNGMQSSLKSYIQRLVTATSDLNHAKNLAVLGATASQINHQIGNFLNNLFLALSILKMDNLSEASRESLEVIEDNTRQIQQFIQRLLSFSRKEKLHLACWVPEENLKRIMAAYRPQAEEKSIRLVFRGRPAQPVLADAALMEQVVGNLIQNALDATPAGGEVELTVGQEGDRVRMDVNDTGQGIPADELSDVFTPFFTTKNGKGTGLGLPLVQTVVQSHGGEVVLQNRRETGVSATIWLPSAPAAFGDNIPSLLADAPAEENALSGNVMGE